MRDRQQWIPGTEPDQIPCGNPRCRDTFYPDPSQPAKKYCSIRCRTIHNNALIAERARQARPPAPETWTVPGTTAPDWDAILAFAGGTESGAQAYLAQIDQAQEPKKRDRRRRYEAAD